MINGPAFRRAGAACAPHSPLACASRLLQFRRRQRLALRDSQPFPRISRIPPIDDSRTRTGRSSWASRRCDRRSARHRNR